MAVTDASRSSADGLIDQAPCCFFRFADDGRIVTVNRTMSQLLGYAPGELDGKPVNVVMAPGGRIFYHTYLFPMLKLHGVVNELYVSFATSTGLAIPVMVNGVRRVVDGRHVNDCIAVCMQKRSEWEGEVLKARKIAEQANAEAACKSEELGAAKAQLESALEDLKNSFWHLRKIADVLPICMECRKVRTREDQWEEVAEYFRKNALLVSHGCCPECEQKHLRILGMTEEQDA